ncbi:MAG: hypothetical protein HY000_23815 [Planctomycetes bacterium]|nr:hypothetical protein [Planctomycetota bacterium]
MRLTLRTLLAYQDDLLEPADAEQLAAKIQESEFASQLVQRAQGVMRQLRLSAPKTLGKGMGLDPNTVAEYLDNTLPAERVADFERVCLESDVHLAEVSACHQILALVLGEPAEVDPEARRAMYTLPTRIASHARAASGAKADRAEEAEEDEDEHPQPASRRSPPEVPDYLREPDRWPKLVPIAAVALLLLLLGAAIWMAADPMNWRSPIAEQSQDTIAEGDKQADQGLPERDAAPVSPAPAQTEEDATKDRGSTPVVEPGDTPPLTVPEDAARPAQPPADATVQNQEPPVPAPADAAPTDAPAAVATGAVPTPPDTATVPPTDAAPPAQPVEAVGGLGRLITANSVLLKHAPELNGWVRIPGGELVVAGDRLLSLPTFRSTLSLTGVMLDLVGPTLVELHSVDDQNVPTITLHYGRLKLLNLAQPNTRIRLRLQNREGLLTFTDPESCIAAEVQQRLSPGVNPETTPAPRFVDLYAISGQSTWQEPPAAEVRTIRAPEHWSLSGGQEGSGTAGPPPWVSQDDTQPIDRRASQLIAEHVTVGDDVKRSLMELSVHRQKENRRLAARCLAQIDEFEPAVDALNDRDHAVFASFLIKSLQSALARDPQTAGRVRESFEKRRGDSGGPLFRMLWGYTPDQLRDGAAAMLVEYLDHPDLDFRILSFSNLQEIVGATAQYRPEASAAERRPKVQTWQRKLEAGEIVPRPAAM